MLGSKRTMNFCPAGRNGCCDRQYKGTNKRHTKLMKIAEKREWKRECYENLEPTDNL